jgi:uncharacterized phage protein (TIGR01671 family)
MQREIKFRGKTKCPIEELIKIEIEHDNEWIYGIYVDGYIINGVVEANNEYIEIESWCGVDENTVGQYTGLKDKNGKEIYEGDILDMTYFLTKNKEMVKFGKYKQCDMSNDYECGNQGFYVDVTNDEHGTYRHDLYFYAHRAIIIGNIYDNPELLRTCDF